MGYHLLAIPVSLGFIATLLVSRNRNDLKTTAIIKPLSTLISFFLP